nr:MAG TPA: hypothetical protein [Caudoviricetes sp.]
MQTISIQHLGKRRYYQHILSMLLIVFLQQLKCLITKK